MAEKGTTSDTSGEIYSLDTVSASCLCKANTFDLCIPKSDLPLTAYFCHCSISRHLSGVLCTAYADIPTSTTLLRGQDYEVPLTDRRFAESLMQSCTHYDTSDVYTRIFCKFCGTHLFLRYRSDGHYGLATGTLNAGSASLAGQRRPPIQVVKHIGHMWIEDSKDGGASPWLDSVSGHNMLRWLVAPGRSDQASRYWSDGKKRQRTQGAVERETLRAYCHCKSVQYTITRPNAASKLASSPYPDLIVPYNCSESPSNPTNETWWLRSNDRYLAGLCACVPCRQASGFDFVAWAFIPRANITMGYPDIGSNSHVAVFRSSDIAIRKFCKRCGAVVMYENLERPSVVDVPVGLLDARSGVRAEEWLQWWTGRVSFVEESVNRPLIDGLEHGLAQWGTQRREDSESKT